MRNRLRRVVIWSALAVLVLLGYPLSYGPGVWLPWRYRDQPWVGRVVRELYRPMDLLATRGPEGVRNALRWYTDLFSPFDGNSSAT